MKNEILNIFYPKNLLLNNNSENAGLIIGTLDTPDDPSGVIRKYDPLVETIPPPLEIKYPDFIYNLLNFIKLDVDGNDITELKRINVNYSEISLPNSEIIKYKSKPVSFDLFTKYYSQKYNTPIFNFFLADIDNSFEIQEVTSTNIVFILDLITAYINQKEISLYFNTELNKIEYTEHTAEVLEFILLQKQYNIKRKFAGTLKESNLKYYKELIPVNLYDDLMEYEEDGNYDDLAWELVFVEQQTECYWMMISDLLEEVRSNNMLDTCKYEKKQLSSVLNYFLDRNDLITVSKFIIPKYYYNYKDNTLYHLNEINNISECNNIKLEKENFIKNIPINENYWIIDSVNWLYKIYGKSFAKIYFGL